MLKSIMRITLLPASGNITKCQSVVPQDYNVESVWNGTINKDVSHCLYQYMWRPKYKNINTNCPRASNMHHTNGNCHTMGTKPIGNPTKAKKKSSHINTEKYIKGGRNISLFYEIIRYHHDGSTRKMSVIPIQSNRRHQSRVSPIN